MILIALNIVCAATSAFALGASMGGESRQALVSIGVFLIAAALHMAIAMGWL